MPELRLVVLALQDKLAYGTTFHAALAALFGGEASSLSATEPPQALPASHERVKPSSDINDLISEAGKDFADYQHLTAEGKLGEAGRKLDALKGLLERLSAHKK
jgi:hypothetical protein